METLIQVGRSDRGQLNWIARLHHEAVPHDHRDMAIPDREVTRAQRAPVDGGADVLFLRQPRQVEPGFAIGPLRQAAAVQSDAGRRATPHVRHAELSEGVPHRVGRDLVRRRRGTAVGQRDSLAGAEFLRIGRPAVVSCAERGLGGMRRRCGERPEPAAPARTLTGRAGART